MSAFVAPFRLRIRNEADSADLLIVSSERGGTNPYLLVPVSADGGTFDPLTSRVDLGAVNIGVIDVGNIFTAIIGDSTKQPAILGLRCYVEIKPVATWEVYASGYLTGSQQRNAISYTVSIGETRRAEQQLMVFEKVTPTFPMGTSVIGGPVQGADDYILLDKGGWRFKVTQVVGNIVELDFQSGTVFVNDPIQGPIFKFVTGVFDAGRVNGLVADSAVYDTTDVASLGIDTAFPTFLARLYNPVTQALVGEFMPVGVGREMVRSNNLLRIKWPSVGSPAQPAVATEFLVYVTAQQASERFPLHYQGHPCDLAGLIHDIAGIPYDAGSLTAVRADVGAEYLVILRPKKAIAASSLLDALFETFKFSRRPTATGTMEFFSTKIGGSTLPSTTIVFGDLRSTEPVIFDIQIGSKRNQLVFTQDVILSWNAFGYDVPANDIAADGLLEKEATWTIDSPDDDADGESDDQEVFGVRAHTIRFPGFVLPGPAQGGYLSAVLPGGLPYFIQGLSTELFARRLRGAPTGQMLVDRAKVVKLGEEVLVTLPHQVNTGTVPSSRGGTRVVQITQITPRDVGNLLSVEDCGVTDVMSVAPTITIGATADDPRHTAQVTVTNAAAIGAIVGTVRIEWATGASAPAGAGQLLAHTWDNPFVVRTPSVAAGTKVWVGAQTTDPVGRKRSTAYTAWASVTLTGLTAPSVLSRTLNVLSWTAGTGLQEVLFRASAEPTDAQVIVLPEGSTRFDLTPYVPPSTSIIASVRSVDAAPLTGASAAVTITYTTPAGAAVSVPVAPSVWVGPPYAGYVDGSAGMEVTGTVYPSLTEMEAATETGVGTNLYGSYVLNGTVDTVRDGRTRLEQYYPNDGLRRLFRARHRVGSTVSSYTAVVGPVDPWGTPIIASDYREAIQYVDSSGLNPHFAAKGNQPGELTGHLRGDQELRAGSFYVEALEDVAAGTVAVPDTFDVDIHIPAPMFQPSTDATLYSLEDNEIQMSTADPIGTTSYFIAPLVLAKGVVITDMALRGRRDGAGEVCEVELRRINQSGGLSTILATVDLISTGYTTRSTTLSETVGTSDAYALQARLYNASAGNKAGLVYVKITYQKALPLRQSV